MRYWPQILLLFLSSHAFAQDVATAEKAFAQMAADSSVKRAFLQFADSNGVVFNNGKIGNAIRSWSAAPDASGPKIIWQPAFYAMSAAGDLGFTTGPYEVRHGKTDTLLVSGQYTTVWKKNSAGDWKFMADLGVDFAPSRYGLQSLQAFTDIVPSSLPDSLIYQLEKHFILAHDSLADEAWRVAAADSAWFNINGGGPFQGTDNFMAALRPVPLALTFEPVAGGVSQSKDLAYVYGYVRHERRQENYLRIWAHTSKGWKLLLQVLRW